MFAHTMSNMSVLRFVSVTLIKPYENYHFFLFGCFDVHEHFSQTPFFAVFRLRHVSPRQTTRSRFQYNLKKCVLLLKWPGEKMFAETCACNFLEFNLFYLLSEKLWIGSRQMFRLSIYAIRKSQIKSHISPSCLLTLKQNAISLFQIFVSISQTV